MRSFAQAGAWNTSESVAAPSGVDLLGVQDLRAHGVGSPTGKSARMRQRPSGSRFHTAR
jgi:hypothetical protein